MIITSEILYVRSQVQLGNEDGKCNIWWVTLSISSSENNLPANIRT